MHVGSREFGMQYRTACWRVDAQIVCLSVCLSFSLSMISFFWGILYCTVPATMHDFGRPVTKVKNEWKGSLLWQAIRTTKREAETTYLVSVKCESKKYMWSYNRLPIRKDKDTTKKKEGRKERKKERLHHHRIASLHVFSEKYYINTFTLLHSLRSRSRSRLTNYY